MGQYLIRNTGLRGLMRAGGCSVGSSISLTINWRLIGYWDEEEKENKYVYIMLLFSFNRSSNRNGNGNYSKK